MSQHHSNIIFAFLTWVGEKLEELINFSFIRPTEVFLQFSGFKIPTVEESNQMQHLFGQHVCFLAQVRERWKILVIVDSLLKLIKNTFTIFYILLSHLYYNTFDNLLVEWDFFKKYIFLQSEYNAMNARCLFRSNFGCNNHTNNEKNMLIFRYSWYPQ